MRLEAEHSCFEGRWKLSVGQKLGIVLKDVGGDVGLRVQHTGAAGFLVNIKRCGAHVRNDGRRLGRVLA